jgi:LDH2 family malate/lactate/ureidoglycolate dehydrogenase
MAEQPRDSKSNLYLPACILSRKATPRRPVVDDIRIPSERAFHSRERALREGLEIDRVVFDALVALRAQG